MIRIFQHGGFVFVLLCRTFLHQAVISSLPITAATRQPRPCLEQAWLPPVSSTVKQRSCSPIETIYFTSQIFSVSVNCVNHPDVAGAAALLLQADPSVTGIQAAQNLVNMATQDEIKGKVSLGSPNSLLYVGKIGNDDTNSVVAAVVAPVSLSSAVPEGHARIVMQVVYDDSPEETRKYRG
jgi:hypothetical protein